MGRTPLDRRAFVGGTLGILTAASVAAATQTPEPTVYAWDLPPKCTLLGSVTFLGDQMIEVTIRSKNQSKSVRGRFEGKRTTELTWENTSTAHQTVQLIATTVDGNHELPWGSVRFAAEQYLFLGFGQRAKPLEQANRHGGYPHDAVFVGFIVFDA